MIDGFSPTALMATSAGASLEVWRDTGIIDQPLVMRCHLQRNTQGRL